MKLLNSTILHLREWFQLSGWFSLAVFASIIGLEIVGRQSTSDLHDSLAAGFLVLIGVVVQMRHRHAPIPWVSWLFRIGNRIGSNIDTLTKFEIGIDLRGTPPLPRRMPPVMLGAMALLVVGCCATTAAWLMLPEGWRTVGMVGSYTLYLLGLSALWLVLFVAVLFGVFLPISVMLNGFRGRPLLSDEPFPPGSMFSIAIYLGVLVAAELTLPISIVPILTLTVGIVSIGLMLPRGSHPMPFLWRGNDPRRIASLPVHRLAFGGLASLAFLLLLTTIASIGGRLFNRLEASQNMPITMLLGTAMTWLTPGLLFAGIYALASLWWNDPCRRSKPSVLVRDLQELGTKRVGAILRKWGFQPHFGVRKCYPSDVAIEVVMPAESEAREFDPRWPLKVSLDDLDEELVRERLERRGEIQLRRYIVHQLKRLIAEVRSQEYQNGSGFWIAPHLLLINGVLRDEPEESPERDESLMMKPLGTPYSVLLHRPARQYLFRMLRALQVDLIFLEDGISSKRLARVLRQMFELYDRSGGETGTGIRVEEIHFQLIPKIRVMIHEFTVDQPFQSDVYPEPKFEELGRARILHIFRDRGAEDSLSDAPRDWTSTPMPISYR
ncbi:hypothetical protein [Tuwongella immobilis]|uniref:Uncharacterized protein n=1 Tax=Tuwongella immobilis TaxID=692036 RepID=A0A6C2YLC5_9BACT|nr:hypothetical protein [Tuwongella immobilis]VIP02111.1 Uncharacterized protein OS=Blastopirellula marina DSM 3645 GN=DSM3645_11497 PE=4 SV=1 [Tuwongella immobilis]VTS00419.1 Uncharacterized protein OS=Blastopirellula marina DSM 3645 GN=DSM3645_11497 PE=4 SV=1 [Tuwongella immobilis]